MSRTPSSLALLVTGPKLKKIQNCQARHMVWLWPSLAKRGETKKCHARHLVWPCLPKVKFQGKQKMSRMSYGLAVAVISKKKEKQKNVMHTVWSGCDCHWAKKRRTKNVTHEI
jgi:hypothetical protein